MAEAVGFAASIIAVVNLAAKLAGYSKFYIENVKDARQDFRRILVETKSLSAALETLTFLLKHDPDFQRGPEFDGLLDPASGAIAGCEQSLQRLVELIPNPSASEGQENVPGSLTSRKMLSLKVKDVTTLLAWPLNKGKAMAALDEVVRFKGTISLVLVGDISKDIKHIKQSLDKAAKAREDEEKERFYRWLVRANPSDTHNLACKQYEQGTGKWVLRCPEWQSWLSTGLHPSPSNRCLWITGIPGAGKTVLASYLFEYLKSLDPEPATWVYYYCLHSRNCDETAAALTWTIRQFCETANILPMNLMGSFRNGTEPSVEDLLEALALLLEHLDQAWLVVDGLDESSPRREIAENIRRLATEPRFSNLKVIATSRDYLEIRQEMEDVSMEISTDNEYVEEDIKAFVRNELRRRSRTTFRRQTEDFLMEAAETIGSKARGMFRLAVLQVEVLKILRWKDEQTLRSELEKLPKELFTAYDHIFHLIAQEAERTHTKDLAVVQKCLSWIFHCNRIFDRDYAVPSAVLVRETGVTNTEDLRNLLGCLVKFAEQKACDYTAVEGVHYWIELVDFAHYTVREYLEHSATRDGIFLPVMPMSEEAFFQQVRPRATKPQNLRSETAGYSITHHLESFYIGVGTKLLRQMKADQSNRPMLSAQLAIELAFELLDPAAPHAVVLRRVMNHKLSTSLNGAQYDLWFPECEEHSKSVFSLYKFWVLRARPEDCRALILLGLLDICHGRLTDDMLTTFEHYAGSSMATLLVFWLDLEVGRIDRHSQTKFFRGTLLEWTAISNIFCDGGRRAHRLALECLLERFGPKIVNLPIKSPYLLHSVLLGHWAHGAKNLFWESDSRFCACQFGIKGKLIPESDSHCIIRKLLELGYPAHSGKDRVTALQMAVFLRDKFATKILLRFGADVNACGNTEGYEFPSQSWLGKIGVLHGASPLYILNNFQKAHEEIYAMADLVYFYSSGAEIENLLLERGARSHRHDV